MIRKIAVTLPLTEDVSTVPGGEGATAEERLLSKAGRRWMPPVENMPPIAQFAVKLAGWCTSKCKSDKKTEAPLRLIGQLPLGGKRHLALVEAGGMQFLVGGGADNVTVIVPVPSAAGAKVDGAALALKGELLR